MFIRFVLIIIYYIVYYYLYYLTKEKIYSNCTYLIIKYFLPKDLTEIYINKIKKKNNLILYLPIDNVWDNNLKNYISSYNKYKNFFYQIIYMISVM